MTKILIRGTQSHVSVGVHAMTICTMEILDKFIPNAEFYIFSTNPEIDHRLYDRYDFNLRVVKYIGGSKALLSRLSRAILWDALHKSFKIDAKRLINDKVLQITSKADIIIDMLGDGFSYDIGGFGGNISPIGHSLNILLATSLGKDVVLFPQSIGPFRNRLVKYFVKFSLNKTKIIVVREELSKNYLEDIGVNKSLMYLTADTAFILETASPERVHEILFKEGLIDRDMPLIGMNISQLLNYRAKNMETTKQEYIELMAELADYLTTTFNAIAIFLPHAIFPEEIVNEAGRDREADITAIKEAYKKVKSKDKIVTIVSEQYSASELKGVIGHCDMFIGARMHANIAATSLCIPTIAISYSIKALGIMQMVGLERYVCDFKTMTFEELKSKADDMWHNREKIKEELEPKIKELKESVWFNGRLVKDLLDKRK